MAGDSEKVNKNIIVNKKLRVIALPLFVILFCLIIHKLYPLCVNHKYIVKENEVKSKIENFYKSNTKKFSLLRLSDTNYDYTNDFQVVKIKDNNILIVGQYGNDIFVPEKFCSKKFENKIRIINNNHLSYNVANYTKSNDLIYVSRNGIYKYNFDTKKIMPILTQQKMFTGVFNKFNLQELSNGNILITGTGKDDCFIWNIQNNHLEKLSNMTEERVGYSTILTPNGNVLFIGGTNKIKEQNTKGEVTQDNKYIESIEEFDAATKKFRVYDSSSEYSSPKLFLEKDKIIIIQPYKNKIDIYNYLTKKLVKSIDVNFKIKSSNLIVKITNDNILILGANSEPKNIFSLNKGIVSLEEDIPSRDYINSKGILLNNKLLIIGGKMQNKRVDLLLY